MSNNKDIIPTIEQSIEMIQKKLSEGKKEKKIVNTKNTNKSKHLKKDNSRLPNLFYKKIVSKDTFLLTKKIDNKGKVVDLKKILKKKEKKEGANKIEEKKDEKNNLNFVNYKNLNKTGDLALIINKLKNLRDNLKNTKNKKNLTKTNQEVKKLNETIDVAEDLFKKELLDL